MDIVAVVAQLLRPYLEKFGDFKRPQLRKSRAVELVMGRRKLDIYIYIYNILCIHIHIYIYIYDIISDWLFGAFFP